MNMSLSFSFSFPATSKSATCKKHQWWGPRKSETLIAKSGIPSTITPPLESLQKGNWVKLICGASFEDAVDIRNLSLVYTLAGEFDPDDCPPDCLRPCENVCPADAISYLGKAGVSKGGVIAERCYGCGRCLPICLYDKIRAITYIRDVAAIAELLKQDEVDAIEIHKSGSGDIGRGATREAIKFALHLASVRDKPKGFLQLAGGTNAHTVEGLKRERLLQTTTISENSDGEKVPLNSFDSSHASISGVAFGGYARKIVGRVLRSLQSEHGYAHLEEYPDHLLKALTESIALVGTVKMPS